MLSNNHTTVPTSVKLYLESMIFSPFSSSSSLLPSISTLPVLVGHVDFIVLLQQIQGNIYKVYKETFDTNTQAKSEKSSDRMTKISKFTQNREIKVSRKLYVISIQPVFMKFLKL